MKCYDGGTKSGHNASTSCVPRVLSTTSTVHVSPLFAQTKASSAIFRTLEQCLNRLLQHMYSAITPQHAVDGRTCAHWPKELARIDWPGEAQIICSH